MKDLIERQAAIDAINTMFAPTPTQMDMKEDCLEIIENLPSAQPKTRTFVELVVEYPDPELCTYKEFKGKPYYSIKYIENGERYVGYGTYKPEVLSQYLKEYFISSAQPEPKWITVSERLPSEEECKEWIDKNLDGIGYLYPCLVTRYSSINPDRTKNNPYVAKHYFDGEDFVNNGEEVCSEYIIAWMPLPEPYRRGGGFDEAD